MKRKRHTEEQIIGILHEASGDISVAEVCRIRGISQATLYAWRRKFGGMDVSEARRLRQLEDENRRLKKLVADLSLSNQMLKDVNSKKW